MSAVLLAAVLLPALAGLLAAFLSAAKSQAARELAGRLSIGTTAVSFALAVTLAVQVAFANPVSAVITDSDGVAQVGLFADRISVLLLLLIGGVSVVVQTFALRYLRAESQAPRFFAAAALLTAATSAIATASTFIGLAVAWTISGVALCLLLGFYSQLPQARVGLRRTATAFAVGDLALWTAVAISTAKWGSIDLREIAARADSFSADPGAVTVVACLLVCAALARCAQLPLPQWLPSTLAAPTPVSALLHAGVVNAGGILLVRLSPIFGASATATHLAFIAGAMSLIYGATLMLVKSDVKGALAHSTVAQMGFMIMTCGIGAFAAAIVHLVAHGMYKATLFLGSGSAVHRHVRHTKAPPAQPVDHSLRLMLAACAALIPAALIAMAAAFVHPTGPGSEGTWALLGFAWCTLAWASWGWLLERPSRAGFAGLVVGSAVAAWSYLLIISAGAEFLAPAITPAESPVNPWLVAPVIALIATVTLIRVAPAGWRFGELQRTLYVLALGASHFGRGRSVLRPSQIKPTRIPLRVQISNSEGGCA